jgi:hypothetical protein
MTCRSVESAYGGSKLNDYLLKLRQACPRSYVRHDDASFEMTRATVVVMMGCSPLANASSAIQLGPFAPESAGPFFLRERYAGSDFRPPAF